MIFVSLVCARFVFDTLRKTTEATAVETGTKKSFHKWCPLFSRRFDTTPARNESNVLDIDINAKILFTFPDRVVAVHEWPTDVGLHAGAH